jgi:hypothetical protein
VAGPRTTASRRTDSRHPAEACHLAGPAVRSRAGRARPREEAASWPACRVAAWGPAGPPFPTRGDVRSHMVLQRANRRAPTCVFLAGEPANGGLPRITPGVDAWCCSTMTLACVSNSWIFALFTSYSYELRCRQMICPFRSSQRAYCNGAVQIGI